MNINNNEKSDQIQQFEPKFWPKRLLEIPEPPKKLWLRGDLPPEDSIFLSVVGSRKFTSYGKQACEKLISELQGLSVVIVSGLALGIDAIAHRAALEADLKTVAIPGSGLHDDVLYPRLNFGLAREILEKDGALISEYSPKEKAAPWMFPRRNRIMVGISHAILVIEAGQKSGTLITARLGTDYNRDVLTVPGSIYSPNSAGPNMLMRLGATPITSGEDLREALGFTDEDLCVSSTSPPPSLTPSEEKIWNLLIEPKSRDQLFVEAEMSISELNEVLTLLEIKDVISEAGGMISRAA